MRLCYAKVIVSLQNVASILGVALAGIVGAFLSWRAPLAIVGALAAATVLVLIFALPSSRSTSRMSTGGLYLSVLRDGSTMFLLLVGFLSMLVVAVWSAYVVVFFQTVFGLEQAVAATTRRPPCRSTARAAIALPAAWRFVPALRAAK